MFVPFNKVPGFYRSCLSPNRLIFFRYSGRNYRSSTKGLKDVVSPRTAGIGHDILDEYAAIRSSYGKCESPPFRPAKLTILPPATPKNPIILSHGLLGFDELSLAGSYFPKVHYWRGITEALRANGIEVITASVPASASIEERAAKLSDDILKKAHGKSVNIIA